MTDKKSGIREEFEDFYEKSFSNYFNVSMDGDYIDTDPKAFAIRCINWALDKCAKQAELFEFKSELISGSEIAHNIRNLTKELSNDQG